MLAISSEICSCLRVGRSGQGRLDPIRKEFCLFRNQPQAPHPHRDLHTGTVLPVLTGLWVLRPLLPDPLGIRAPAGEKCTYFSYSLGGAAVAALVGRGQWAPLHEAVDVVALFPVL